MPVIIVVLSSIWLILGLDGILSHSCGCKHDTAKKGLKCTNCKCAKVNVPCSGGCCCKGACSNALLDSYAETGIFSRRASRMEEVGDTEGFTKGAGGEEKEGDDDDDEGV